LRAGQRRSARSAFPARPARAARLLPRTQPRACATRRPARLRAGALGGGAASRGRRRGARPLHERAAAAHCGVRSAAACVCRHAAAARPWQAVTWPPALQGPVSQSSQSNWRPEWQPDKSTKACSTCSKNFNMLQRRHHCRHCGRVICGKCGKKKHRVVLLKYGYHEPVRVCVSCHEVCTQSEELMAAISANGYVAGGRACARAPHAQTHRRTRSTHARTHVPSERAASAQVCERVRSGGAARRWGRPQLLDARFHALHACCIQGPHQVDAGASPPAPCHVRQRRVMCKRAR